MKFTVPFINLDKQYQSVKKEVAQNIRRVLASGSLVLGENVKKFEEEFARYCNVKYAVGVASGTEARCHDSLGGR